MPTSFSCESVIHDSFIKSDNQHTPKSPSVNILGSYFGSHHQQELPLALPSGNVVHDPFFKPDIHIEPVDHELELPEPVDHELELPDPLELSDPIDLPDVQFKLPESQFELTEVTGHSPEVKDHSVEVAEHSLEVTDHEVKDHTLEVTDHHLEPRDCQFTLTDQWDHHLNHLDLPESELELYDSSQLERHLDTEYFDSGGVWDYHSNASTNADSYVVF